jgi:hypothetical protein
VFLIEWEAGYHAEHKGIQHYGEHDEAEPGKKLKEVLCDKMPQVYKGFPVYIPDK